MSCSKTNRFFFFLIHKSKSNVSGCISPCFVCSSSPRYAYTRDVPSDMSTVVQIIQAADRFQIEGLLKTCCHALVQEISLETCMQIRSLARAFPFSCCAIKVAADKFLLENFTWIYCFSSDFLQLDTDDLCDVLANDRLNVRTESIPLDAVCR